MTLKEFTQKIEADEAFRTAVMTDVVDKLPEEQFIAKYGIDATADELAEMDAPMAMDDMENVAGGSLSSAASSAWDFVKEHKTGFMIAGGAILAAGAAAAVYSYTRNGDAQPAVAENAGAPDPVGKFLDIYIPIGGDRIYTPGE